MNWKEIEVAPDGRGFQYRGKPVFARSFDEVLKFHEPGLAPVKDSTGSYHINTQGNALYHQRYLRSFGFYEGFAAVVDREGWFHIDVEGNALYPERYRWLGNFQGGLCTAEYGEGHFLYLTTDGIDSGLGSFLYAGDFRDGIACVMDLNGKYRHLTKTGSYLHPESYDLLGVYHKGYATAKDSLGWFHIDMQGRPVYTHRFSYLEPFYNGTALALDRRGRTIRVHEDGSVEWLLP